MYLPSHFEEAHVDVLHSLIRSRPLATLITMTTEGVEANHIPLQLDAGTGEFGTLCGHVARANRFWHEHPAGAPVLAIFHGPDSYISPSWYASKKTHGKVVPTWNYAVVHARARLRVIDDPAWLLRHLAALTDANEAGFPAPWAVADAPREFTERLLTAIVGIELTITALTGKWKASQNQPEGNRAGVVAGLRERGDASASAMAALVERGVAQ
jgi:transcriptional regulator